MESKPTESRAVRAMAAVSRSVVRRARQAHYARAVCGALATFAVVLACAIQRGAALGDLEAVGLALILAGLAFVAWGRSERLEPRDVLERVDQRLHLGGAFLAAEESCVHTPHSLMAQLGAARLLQRVRPSQALEAAVPHTLGFVVLPLLGLLVLVQTVQSRDARYGRAGRVHVEVSSVAEELGTIAQKNREQFTPEQLEELAEIQREARAAALRAEDESLGREPEVPAGGAEPPDWREQLRDVAEDLDELAERAPAGSEVADDLSDAAAAAEALAMDADEGEPAPSSESSAADSSVGGDDGSGRAAGSTEGPSDAAAAGDSAPDPMGQSPPMGAATPGGAESEDVPVGIAEGDLAGQEELPADVQRVSAPGEPAGTGAGDPSSDGRPQGSVEAASVASGSPGAPGGPGAQGDGEVSGPGGEVVLVPTGDAPVGADVAPSAPRGAEEVLAVRRWWSDRDDSIVRAWLAKRSPL